MYQKIFLHLLVFSLLSITVAESIASEILWVGYRGLHGAAHEMVADESCALKEKDLNEFREEGHKINFVGAEPYPSQIYAPYSYSYSCMVDVIDGQLRYVDFAVYAVTCPSPKKLLIVPVNPEISSKLYNFRCAEYCPESLGESCQPPDQENTSCTASKNPIDFISGKKFLSETMIFELNGILKFNYNNQHNMIRTSYGLVGTNQEFMAEIIHNEGGTTSPQSIIEGDIKTGSLETISWIKFQPDSDEMFDTLPRYNGNTHNPWRHSFEDFLVQENGDWVLYSNDGSRMEFNSSGYASSHKRVKVLEINGEVEFSGRLVQFPDGKKDYFDEEGKLRKRVINNFEFIIEYDESFKRITKITSNFSEEIVFSYYNNGSLQAISSGDNTSQFTWTTPEINSSSSETIYLLSSIEQYIAGGLKSYRKYLYEDNRWPISVTKIIDGDEHMTEQEYATFRYDDYGKAIYSSLANGVDATSVEYLDEYTRVVTNALGKKATYKFEVAGYAKRLKSITGEATSWCKQSNVEYTYTPQGLISTKNQNGVLTKYYYNYTTGQETDRYEAYGTADQKLIKTEWDLVHNKPSKITYPDRIELFTYNDDGQLLTTTITER